MAYAVRQRFTIHHVAVKLFRVDHVQFLLNAKLASTDFKSSVASKLWCRHCFLNDNTEG